jgi:hypothetical protein
MLTVKREFHAVLSTCMLTVKTEFRAVLSTCMLRGLMRPTGTYLEHRGQRHLTLHIPKRLTRHLTKGKLRVRRYVPETAQGHSGLS